jgi:hypothetical protein
MRLILTLDTGFCGIVDEHSHESTQRRPRESILQTLYELYNLRDLSRGSEEYALVFIDASQILSSYRWNQEFSLSPFQGTRFAATQFKTILNLKLIIQIQNCEQKHQYDLSVFCLDHYFETLSNCRSRNLIIMGNIMSASEWIRLCKHSSPPATSVACQAPSKVNLLTTWSSWYRPCRPI